VALVVGKPATAFFTFLLGVFIATWPIRELYRAISISNPNGVKQ
jgi:hypothetical protein